MRALPFVIESPRWYCRFIHFLHLLLLFELDLLFEGERALHDSVKWLVILEGSNSCAVLMLSLLASETWVIKLPITERWRIIMWIFPLAILGTRNRRCPVLNAQVLLVVSSVSLLLVMLLSGLIEDVFIANPYSYREWALHSSDSLGWCLDLV